jgi:hypothetical protein
MRREFEILREAARREPNPEARERQLADVDKLEKLAREMEEEKATLKKRVEAYVHPRKFLGIEVGGWREWLLLIGLVILVPPIAITLDLTYKETGLVAFVLMLPVCAYLLISTYRLRKRIKAWNKHPSHEERDK